MWLKSSFLRSQTNKREEKSDFLYSLYEKQMDLGKMWELKKMYDKYRELQKALKNLVIRAKEGEYTDENWEKAASVLVDMTGEMKLKDFKINDTSLLDLSKKEVLEDLVLKAFQKAQNKAQEIAWVRHQPHNHGAFGYLQGQKDQWRGNYRG